MKIQIASDLHLEFPGNRAWLKNNPLTSDADLLILAGDIILNKFREHASPFFNDIIQRYPQIIAIPGNHEFYQSHVSYVYPELRINISPNYLMLNNSVQVIENIRIIASIMWTNIPKKHANYLYRIMNDYRLISMNESDEKNLLSIERTNSFHQNSVKFLEKELAKPFNGKTIVITHHAPSMDCYYKTQDKRLRILKYAYCADMQALIEKSSIDVWIHGHVHRSIDFTMHDTRIIANPLGYMDEKQKYQFKPDFTIDL